MFITVVRVKRVLAAAAALLLLCGLGAGAIQRQNAIKTSAEATKKVVYLTFDDGPSVVTPQILDLLAEKQVKATFFVIGATTQRGKDLYQRILEEGHTLGLHSYSHRYNEIYASADSYMADLFKLREHIYGITGVECNIFRFPGGSTNATASKQVIASVKEMAETMGLRYFDWNALGKDDRAKASSAEDIFRAVVDSAGEKNRILILLHDDALRTTAPQAVEKIIDHYTALGYEFLPLTEDTEPIIF